MSGTDFPDLTWDLLDKETVTEFSERATWLNWPNVQWTARRFWAAQGATAGDSWQRRAAWHHLVMTAGNFKRQTPITLPDLPDVPDPAHIAGEVFTIGAGHGSVKRVIPESWEQLTGIHGMAVATATTVLSALWPGYHVILDQQDVGAGIGLAYDEACHMRLVRDAGYKGTIVSWPRYKWFRRKVVAKAAAIGVEAVVVERALYEIGKASGASSDITWQEYLPQLCRVLNV